MKKKYNYVIIAGCSRFGVNIASLLSAQGNDVIVIDKDKTAFRKLLHDYSGFKMYGDATDIDILMEAGIKKANIVLAATDDDNTNIMISQIASELFEVDKVVSRIYDTEKEIVYSDLDVKIIRPAKLSINEFERLALDNVTEVH
ncbi:trk system potassium uptake protein TrkA [Clostridium tetanomorphum]|uniref:TrkA family potassium uptake protein n=1 Tax=Clostridium tetanomorphum TaxID=1553 RepID=A0A923EBA3_CLOTT|nr:TrkA family potassium uptake protein [Clostridium tetanomorphum]KAJ53739.1 TrkA-N domain-containing protein [Clostridium tetanomorphum DSM 665]MBC2397250.1 TrkA family potassium uptake protein [Clostridium tetanomorphum]MBP1862467.1 trk system potassium uptake protein TrkA [Clostridium tetanomorphum]NRS85693.1 trk system potassium uptake protein TrkA [Clostridium tetanomorphum]NRZ96297.1 trk system potassium uptake protein TrkA [Clostridium tetanomorphum]